MGGPETETDKTAYEGGPLDHPYDGSKQNGDNYGIHAAKKKSDS